MTAARDKRLVANPLLALPGVVRAMDQLDDAQRSALAQSLLFIRADCQAKAQHAWEKHKAPMAAYWKACGVYAGHLARVLTGKRQGKPGPAGVAPSQLRRTLARYRDGKVDLDVLLTAVDRFLGDGQ